LAQDLAKFHYSQAISLNSNYSEAYLARGYLRRTQMKDLTGALQDLTTGIDLAGTGWGQFWAPKSQVLEFRAAVRKEKGDIEGAIADYGAAIAAHPGKDDLKLVYEKRAEARKEEGDVEGAISDLTHVIWLGPASSDYLSRGELRKAKGNLKAALADFT
jgi:tetratricopeptide (TPR) repeat protein